MCEVCEALKSGKNLHEIASKLCLLNMEIDMHVLVNGVPDYQVQEYSDAKKKIVKAFILLKRKAEEGEPIPPNATIH